MRWPRSRPEEEGELNRALPRRHYACILEFRPRVRAQRVQNGSTRQFTTRRYVSPPITSPIGPLLLAGDQHGLRFLLFAHGRKEVRPRPEWVADQADWTNPFDNSTHIFAAACATSRSRSHHKAPSFSGRSGPSCSGFPLAKPLAMANWPRASAIRRRCGRSGSRMARINLDHHSLSSRDWQQRIADRLPRAVMHHQQALLALVRGQAPNCEVHAP